MKILLKSLIVWVMLLAVPFQGFASATMLFCTPIQSSAPAAMDAPHDHQAMLMAQAAQHDHHDAGATSQAHHQDTNDKSPGSHHGGKCNSCAACCFGAAMAPSHALPIAVDSQMFIVIPFNAGSFPTVDLAHPERPPQASLT